MRRPIGPDGPCSGRPCQGSAALQGRAGMGWFRGKKSYDRSRIIADARRAAQRGDHVKAIAHYERVQEVEPQNTDVRRLAAERAQAEQRVEAWCEYRAAAEGLIRAPCHTCRWQLRGVQPTGGSYGASARLGRKLGLPRSTRPGACAETSRTSRSPRAATGALTWSRSKPSPGCIRSRSASSSTPRDPDEAGQRGPTTWWHLLWFLSFKCGYP